MSYLFDRWKLWKLERLRHKTRKAYERKAKLYREDKTKTRHDMEALNADDYFEGRAIDEAVAVYLSNRLLDLATHYDIEIPHDPESWEHSEDGEQNYLNAKARASLRELIYPARKRSFEEWTKWLPFIGAITGLIGVITGLVAVSKK